MRACVEYGVLYMITRGRDKHDPLTNYISARRPISVLGVDDTQNQQSIPLRDNSTANRLNIIDDDGCRILFYVSS